MNTVLVKGEDLSIFKKEYAKYSNANTQSFAMYDVKDLPAFIAFCSKFCKKQNVQLTLMIVNDKNITSEKIIKP